MNLLRHVLDENNEEADASTANSLKIALDEQFKIPEEPQIAVQALSLISDVPANVSATTAMARLKRHLHSTGYFGPGLAAVVAKYGSNSEIAQVACRAGAVGGFVYLLGQGVSSIQPATSENGLFQVELTDGTKVRSKYVVGMKSDFLPGVEGLDSSRHQAPSHSISHRISIVSNSLKPLFTSPLDTGPVPAVSIVFVNTGEQDQAPIYLQIHSEETGECPTGQCKSLNTLIFLSPSVMNKHI